MKKIRVGHSPDADDAFMFYAVTQGKIPVNGFRIEHVIEDIESLNRKAFRYELEVTALSCHAFGFLSDRYALIPYGASIGEGYGPIVAAKYPLTPTLSPQGGEGRVRGAIRGSRIAVPGRYTTAYLALQLYEKDFEPVFIPFDRIFDALEGGKADFGLLIHEGQLTYAEKGFQKILDLGEWWQKKYKLPLPLGINAIRRDLEPELISGFTKIFKESIDYAMEHREEAMRYALKFGRGIDPKRGDRFVGMYVNEYSLDLGERGKEALSLLFDLGRKRNLFPQPVRL